MGSYGTWRALTKFPELFAAAAPICGGGDASKICAAKDVAVKAFHAKDDNVTPYSKSVSMIKALNECGGDAELKTAESGGHGIWPYIYVDSDFYGWLLTHSRRIRFICFLHAFHQLTPKEVQYVLLKAKKLGKELMALSKTRQEIQDVARLKNTHCLTEGSLAGFQWNILNFSAFAHSLDLFVYFLD